MVHYCCYCLWLPVLESQVPVPVQVLENGT